MRHIPVRAPTRRRALFLFPALLTVSPAAAAPGPPNSPPTAPSDEPSPVSVVTVTWSDLVRLVDRHPKLAAGRFRVDAARGEADAAGAVPNPVIEGDLGRGLAPSGNASRLEWGLALTIPLGWIAQRGSRIDAAAAEVDATAAESELLRRDVLLQLQTLFWGLIHDQARIEALVEFEEQTRALVSAVAKLVEKGEVRPVEAMRVGIELEMITIGIEAARTSLASRQEQLTLWLGATRSGVIVAEADLDALPSTASLDIAEGEPRGIHPVLVAAQARNRSLEAVADTERMARVPTVSLTGFATSELDRRAYGVGIAVDLPLWNWNAGRIAKATAEVAAGRKRAEATAFDLETTVIGAQAACRASVQTATRLGHQVVPLAEAVAFAMEQAYRLGELDLIELIDARRTFLGARRLHVDALAQAQIDCGRLGVLVGEEPQ
jgi:cobalt-zinc-cadmium efflux system outer membrane protein